MAVDYFTGFETGDASQMVSLGTNATIQTTTKRTGAYALKQAFNGTTSTLKTGLNRASGSWRAGFLIHFTTDASFAADTIILQTAGSVNLATVTSNSNGAGAYSLKLAYFVGGGGAFTVVGSPFTISADTWYVLEVRWVISATVGELELFVDGVSRASGTGLNLGSTNADRLLASPWFTNGSVDQYFDDVCAADARTGVGKSGLYKVKSGSPTYDAWTKQGGGAIVAEWVDVPFSATNNARSTAASQAQTGLIEDPAAASVAIASGDTINAATLGAIIKRLTTSPSPTTQTRNPTSEVSVTGTWSGTNRHLLLDDYPDSGNPITDGTTCSAAGVAVFGFSAFSVPAGATSISVQVLYYDFKNGTQASTIGAAIRCNDTTNRLSATHNPANGNAAIAARSDNYATNPKSAAAWTVDDVNGVGTNGLTAFGLSVTDASPTVTVSCVQLQVTYTPAATDGTYKLRRRVASSDTDTAKTLTTTDAWYDDGIWTASLTNLQSAEIGAFRDSGGDHNVQVEDAYLFVDFTPVSVTETAGAISGVVTLTSVAAAQALTAATLTATGTLAAAGASRNLTVAVVTATGTLTGSAATVQPAVASLTATGTVTGATDELRAATAAVTSTGTLTGVSTTIMAATGVIGATGTWAGVGEDAGGGTVIAETDGVITATGTLAGAAAALTLTTAGVTASGTLTGVDAQVGASTASLTGTGAFTGTSGAVAGTVDQIAGTATFAGQGADASGGTTIVAADGVITASATLSGQGARLQGSAAIISATGTLAGVGGRVHGTVAGLTGTATATGTSQVIRAATAQLVAVAELVGVSGALAQVVAAISGRVTLDGDGDNIGIVSVNPANARWGPRWRRHTVPAVMAGQGPGAQVSRVPRDRPARAPGGSPAVYPRRKV